MSNSRDTSECDDLYRLASLVTAWAIGEPLRLKVFTELVFHHTSSVSTALLNHPPHYLFIHHILHGPITPHPCPSVPQIHPIPHPCMAYVVNSHPPYGLLLHITVPSDPLYSFPDTPYLSCGLKHPLRSIIQPRDPQYSSTSMLIIHSSTTVLSVSVLSLLRGCFSLASLLSPGYWLILASWE